MVKARVVAKTGVMKQCFRCKIIKDTSEFHKYARNRDRLQPYCHICKKAIDKEHYKNNPRRNYERNRANVHRNRMWLHNFLKSKQCEWDGCNISDPDMLVLDHKNPSEKRLPVSIMVHASFSLRSIQEEVAKCRVLCANHHQKHTIWQFGYKKWLVED
jgi:hypothetical protein